MESTGQLNDTMQYNCSLCRIQLFTSAWMLVMLHRVHFRYNNVQFKYIDSLLYLFENVYNKIEGYRYCQYCKSYNRQTRRELSEVPIEAVTLYQQHSYQLQPRSRQTDTISYASSTRRYVLYAD